MKQILQSLKTGKVELADIPCPAAGPGQLLISTRVSLISSGTERMLVDFGKANLLDKARQQPDKVRQVLAKARTDGLAATFNAVQNKLDQPLALGYCNAGTVVGVGVGVEGFTVGDRVASNGKHAEMVAVPSILCAKIPDGVGDEAAAFTVVSAIALQGVRLASPTLGESFVVIGLGLIGLITVQILRANGCRVLGIDFDEEKLALAEQFGASVVNPSQGEDALAAATRFSHNRGVDGVLITASTKSNEPVHQAAQMCRKRGRIILVGVAGLELSRADFYEKELTFQVSCSYGPGRYDPQYEEQGHDYPFAFVRWTEQRNFEAVLDMMAERRIDVGSLVSHRFPLEDFEKAYDLVGGGGRSLGILLTYPSDDEGSMAAKIERVVRLEAGPTRPAAARVGFLGAGNYAGQVLVPAFAAAGASLGTVVSAGGVSGRHVARKNGFARMATSADAVLDDPDIDTVVIATRHDLHAEQVCAALRAGKHVFVEKPIALHHDEVARIAAEHEAASKTTRPILTIGFNRRFSPLTERMKGLLNTVQEPKALVMTVNAGQVPADHWTQSRVTGGGRLLGEACHFVDLSRHLVGHEMAEFHVLPMGGAAGSVQLDDRATISLRFKDGSIATIHYLANGHKAFPKERIEVFCAGRVLQLDNFRSLAGWGWPGFRRIALWRQDKGNAACVARFVDAVRYGGAAPIPFDELMEVSRVSIDIAESARLRC